MTFEDKLLALYKETADKSAVLVEEEFNRLVRLGVSEEEAAVLVNRKLAQAQVKLNKDG